MCMLIFKFLKTLLFQKSRLDFLTWVNLLLSSYSVTLVLSSWSFSCSLPGSGNTNLDNFEPAWFLLQNHHGTRYVFVVCNSVFSHNNLHYKNQFADIWWFVDFELCLKVSYGQNNGALICTISAHLAQYGSVGGVAGQAAAWWGISVHRCCM